MADDIPAELAEAKRIADGLHFACRIPDKVPDFTACGGPAAEAYWAYFTPLRIVSLLAALETALAFHEESGGSCGSCLDAYGDRIEWPCEEFRAITAALTENDSAPAGAVKEDGGP